MSRSARPDAPGVLHHVMMRGIERRRILDDDADRDNFVDRLSVLLPERKTPCYAWAFLPNHAHFLFRSGSSGLPTLMRRLLTGYGVAYNKKHKRHGQLFQNRYKSIISQEDIYLKELVRYIHLNPLRAKVLNEMKELDGYAYKGFSFEKILNRLSGLFELDRNYIIGKGRQKRRVEARDLLCYWAVNELGMSQTDLAVRLGMSTAGVGYAVARGEMIANKHQCQLFNQE
ncbi:MAG: transposase [Deltaproteobacteria bacterium]|nr:transposase [Deltaproteobacteria bacterium]